MFSVPEIIIILASWIVIAVLIIYIWQVRRVLSQMNEINQTNAIKNARLTAAFIAQIKETPPPAYSVTAARATSDGLPSYSSMASDPVGSKKKKKAETPILEFSTEMPTLPISAAI